MGKTLIIKCINCGASLNMNERCSCQIIDLQFKQINESNLIVIARSVAAAIKTVINPDTGKFKNTALQSEYEKWHKKKYNNQTKGTPAVCSR